MYAFKNYFLHIPDTVGVSLYQYFVKANTFKLTLIPLAFWGLAALVLLNHYCGEYT